MKTKIELATLELTETLANWLAAYKGERSAKVVKDRLVLTDRGKKLEATTASSFEDSARKVLQMALDADFIEAFEKQEAAPPVPPNVVEALSFAVGELKARAQILQLKLAADRLELMAAGVSNALYNTCQGSSQEERCMEVIREFDEARRHYRKIAEEVLKP